MARGGGGLDDRPSPEGLDLPLVRTGKLLFGGHRRRSLRCEFLS